MLTDQVIVTVVTSNFLPYSAVLAESIHEHNPDMPIVICIVDLTSTELPEPSSSIRYLAGEELNIPSWKRVAFQYNAKELSAALKSFAVGHLLNEGFTKVVLLDADIQVYGTLGPTFDLLETHSLLLTPHWSEPGPEDGGFPSAPEVRLYGVYNTGFMGFRQTQETQMFVEWWKERCYSNCIVDIPAGIFVDQSWVDLAPSFVSDCLVVRNSGWNVAYWNLPNRTVSGHDGNYLVNEEPLLFFHFSGLDPANLQQLSRFSNRDDFGNQPVALDLAKDYVRRLRFQQKKYNLDYRFSRLSDGTEIRSDWRRVMRQNLPNLAHIEDPFDVSETRKHIVKLEAAVRSKSLKENFFQRCASRLMAIARSD